MAHRAGMGRELATAVAADGERRAVDAMKKRAMGTAQSYAEFRNLVACATLQPLAPGDSLRMQPARGRGDRLRRQQAASGPWTGAPQVAAAAPPAAGLAGATSGAQFEKAWRAEKRDPQRAFAALRRLAATPPGLAGVLRVELDGMLLGELLSCCDAATAAVPVGPAAAAGAGDDAAPTLGAAVLVLSQLSGAGRFPMALAMCSRGDVVHVARVVQRARAAGVDAPQLRALAAAYELPTNADDGPELLVA